MCSAGMMSAWTPHPVVHSSEETLGIRGGALWDLQVPKADRKAPFRPTSDGSVPRSFRPSGPVHYPHGCRTVGRPPARVRLGILGTTAEGLKYMPPPRHTAETTGERTKAGQKTWRPNRDLEHDMRAFGDEAGTSSPSLPSSQATPVSSPQQVSEASRHGKHNYNIDDLLQEREWEVRMRETG